MKSKVPPASSSKLFWAIETGGACIGGCFELQQIGVRELHAGSGRRPGPIAIEPGDGLSGPVPVTGRSAGPGLP
ncbi:unnamed protein product [Victoria cruziana]